MIELYGNNNKYNIDAIASCLRAGFENYINSKYHILSSYKDIGRMFPAYYLQVTNEDNIIYSEILNEVYYYCWITNKITVQ